MHSTVATDRPALPSLRELEVLRAVVTLRTTAAAARALAVSQPAVSRSLASLEDRLGRSLFARQNGALVPTAEAVALSDEAGGILQALGRIAGRAAPSGAEVLHVATTATLAHCLLAPLLPGLVQAHPDLRLHVEITTSAAVVTMVADGTADAGLLDMAAPHGSVSAEVLARNEAHVVLPPGHALAAHKIIGVRELADWPIVALPRRFALRARLDDAFRDTGLAPVLAMECATAMFAADMVRRGVGVAVLNPFPLRDACPSLVFRPFAPAVALDTAAIVPSGAAMRPLARRLVDYIRAHGMGIARTSNAELPVAARAGTMDSPAAQRRVPGEAEGG